MITKNRIQIALLVTLAMTLHQNIARANADAGVVAAALQTGKSECQYLSGLCKEVRELYADSHQRMIYMEQVLARAQETRNTKDIDVAQTAITMAKAASNLAGTQLLRTTDAMRVIRAKHDAMPECFSVCSDVIKIDNFK